MRSEWFEFRPQFKAWLATNHKPDVRGTDEAIWRRFRLIPFTVTIPEADRDPKLPEKLRAELPGILAQAVAACLDWQEHGLPKADAVTAATQEYRSDNDVIGRFLDDCCALHADATARAGDLYASYGYWCTANGEQPLSQRAFGLRLHERGYTQQRTKSARMWLGLGLRAVTSEGDG
jgi:putative DNA primase/helicase